MLVVAGATVGVVNALGADNAGTRAVVMFVGDSNVAVGAKWPVWDLTSGDTGDHVDNNYVPAFVARGGSGIRTLDCVQSETSACQTYDFWKLKLAGVLTKVEPAAIVTELGVNDTFEAGG